MSLNAHYHVVFRNRRGASPFHVFASQMAPHRSGWLLDAFLDATRQPFGYLLIDNHLRTADEQRIRTRYCQVNKRGFTGSDSWTVKTALLRQHNNYRMMASRIIHRPSDGARSKSMHVTSIKAALVLG